MYPRLHSSESGQVTSLFRGAVTRAKPEQNEDVLAQNQDRDHQVGGAQVNFWGADSVLFLDLGFPGVFGQEYFSTAHGCFVQCSVMTDLTFKREKI